MNKTKLGMLGAVSALAALPMGAQAAATQPAVAPAQSFSELLQPIPNAVERLDASNRELAGGAFLLPAQFNNHHHHHNNHNHHSRAWWRAYYRHLMWLRSHHHHHHDNGNDHNHYNDNNYNNNNNNNHNHNHNNPY
jgi:hypothetical protein